MTRLLSVFLLLSFARLASSAACAAAEWRSSLYPGDWAPGHADAQGRFLHDFSYAGYHRGEKNIPDITGPVFDVTAEPYSADPSGRRESTAAIQRAIDAAGDAGGGVVLLPPGTYRVTPPADARAALRLDRSRVVLRGAGADRTFLFNDSTSMRSKRVIEIAPRRPVSWRAEGKPVKGAKILQDLPRPTRRIPLDYVDDLAVGDLVIVRNDLTRTFIDRIGMGGKWTPGHSPNRTLLYCRTITAIDPETSVVTVDIPLRGFLHTEDNAQLLKVSGEMLEEVGLEDFSIGMKQHPGEGLAENDWNKPGTVGYDAHNSSAIFLSYVQNSWVRRVRSWAPPGNDPRVHVLSNSLKLYRARLVTVAECDFRFPQYRGGGGNGYHFTHNGQDNLVRDCHAEGARHNYDFGTMLASGNVILDSTAKDGRLASDFHMFLSLANLIDNLTCDGDFIEARAFRPWGGNPVHGVTTTQSVFWNTRGLSPSKERPVLVYSHQFGEGYVIGTRGPFHVVDSTDFVEGVGKGDSLVPRSLYLDQLRRRLAASRP
jgi:Endopolygalacturonase